MKLTKIVLASNNTKKLKELSALFTPWGIELISQPELQIGEADEPFPTFVENALTKARYASKLTGLPALADDSGLCVDILDGAPGVYSARYAHTQGFTSTGDTDHDNNDCLLTALKSFQTIEQRKAHFLCVLAFMSHHLDPQPIIITGEWSGQILKQPRGENGFGYDPVFYDPTLNKSAAELHLAEKNKYSHRAKAIFSLQQELIRRYPLPS